MISIIICSKESVQNNRLLNNITSTIGVEHEIIIIDNSKNEYSIFQAYNKGAGQAKYSNLCFMHEDIVYHTDNWGQIVNDILSDPDVGVLGVAGSKYVSNIPSPWWLCNQHEFTDLLVYNIIQHYKVGSAHKKNIENHLEEVIVLDGVWLCCSINVWRDAQFDQQTFSGFHFYDMDFCLSAWKNGYKNVVSSQILIEHLSSGNVNKGWVETAFVFNKKWSKHLPVSLIEIPPRQKKQIRKEVLFNLINVLSKTKSLRFLRLSKYLLHYTSFSPTSKKNLSLIRMCINNYLR